MKSSEKGRAAYRKYLESETWKTIRAQRLAMDNGEGVLCGDAARHVHHRRYPNKWGTETVNDLVSLCDICHGKHHDCVNTEDSNPADTVFDGISLGGDWRDAQLLCPECGCEYIHMTNVEEYEDDDYYEHMPYGWGGRGCLKVVNMYCEYGCDFSVCFGFHKGQTMLWATTKDVPLTQWDDDSILP